MQEVFEKIIEKLEALEKVFIKGNSHNVAAGIRKVIEIVKQDAAEYNNGWIPCSGRLPDCCGYPVLITVENTFGQRSVCKAFTNYMKEGKLLFYTNEKEYCKELTSSRLSDAFRPIAWKPLPDPYQPKG